ncbi:MAG: RagB/SusD family nutrient uptake outer membrane protein [Prolixibacteraceae bacterium]|jgi:starch-binding outer membrane protein, SusD/RagB family|nr:RagB/SusD family nutrient uptake outer membrane protein [Prolixibacteraceae bacterium]MBT6763072.1 RagB/SusD family nutrient uptake outer membrane protein [Prolixibacteraceae bacterium]MBT7000152.1 RagB/SusD family nutrient uptake outer membrane protein [Prolixibacteraceae bacterium]MBT7395642.1 RagB/SusD family nutrient uptake outer membrane protein [Prolixibacteraceae bacterium]
MNMKLKNIITYSLLSLLILTSGGCVEEFLDFFPEDKITSANFPVNEDDMDLLLNGLYGQLRENALYNQGFFAYGVLDGATPNGWNWGNLSITKIGNGQLSATDGQIVSFRWTRAYAIIFRANYLIKALEVVELSADIKSMYEAEARFLRGVAYATLVESYGGVPIVLDAISTEEARTIGRNTADETWNQAISDYDFAIANLDVNAPQVGRATKGAAMAMKMRAYLYQNKFSEVISLADQIIGLGKYSLFPTYDGLFQMENENNQEVIFDIQYMRGENSQGNRLDQFTGTGTGSWTRGTRYTPTENLVNAYERIDGSPGKYFESEIDLDNPYDGWDPRLKVTCVVPGAYYLDYRFPNYLYPGGAYNHPGNRIKHLSTRKYREDVMADLAPTDQSDLNNIVIRYADILLSKSEALIESGGDVDEAIALINRIRTEREDVKMTPIPTGLSREDVRGKLRHERRIEFALEGLYWMDIKRWHKMDGFLNGVYPIEIRDHNGGLVETKFPDGFKEHFGLLPIPNGELSLNGNLEQNPGW